MKLLFPILVFILLFLITFAHWVEAETIPFDLVVVKRDEISTQDQINLFYIGAARLREVGVNIKVVSVREVPDYLQKNEYRDYVNRLFDWKNWASANRIRKNSRHIHFLLPPVKLNGRNYQGGSAGAVCTTTRNPSRKFSYSIVRLKNDSGEDRRIQSVTIAAHELLHNLGSNHNDGSANIMHSNAAIYNYSLPIVSSTRRQVNYCKQGKNPLGTRMYIQDFDKPFN